MGMYVGVGGSVGPFYAGVGGRVGGRGGRGGGGGGLDGVGMALAIVAAFLAAWLVAAALWLGVLVVLAVSDLAFVAGRGVGFAFGSRVRGEGIVERGVWRWAAVRWWCRTGVTRGIWRWSFRPARTIWDFVTCRRGPREWLDDGRWISEVLAVVAGVTGGIMIFWTGSNYIHTITPVYSYADTPVNDVVTREWVSGEVEWWAWATAGFAVAMGVTWLVCTLLRGFFSPLEQQVRPVAEVSAAPAVVLEPPALWAPASDSPAVERTAAVRQHVPARVSGYGNAGRVRTGMRRPGR